MTCACEGEEVFFDSLEQLMADDLVCEKSDYDIWLSEPESVRKRRQSFLFRMGFVESSTFSEFEPHFECREVISGGCSLSAAASDDIALLSERRKSNSEANSLRKYEGPDWLDNMITENHVAADKCEIREVEDHVEKKEIVSGKKSKKLRWLRHLSCKTKKNGKLPKEPRELIRVRVEHTRKRYMECTAAYTGQQVKAHDGLIRAMKFSPDGQYLASGGADGVICIWRVYTVDASSLDNYCNYNEIGFDGKKTKKIQASVVIPEKIFRLDENPQYKFRAHRSDILDLAWSASNHLLSSSMDKTVCLWRAGSDECLGVFPHRNYVTCVEFNPADETCFISGSIDGKVRIWGAAERRVKDWVIVPDIVTAVSYQPNGDGFVVGSISGNCRSYVTSGNELVLKAEMNIKRKRKSSSNRITGIQFLKNDSGRVMITSEDSKIRILKLNGLELVRKYKGLPKSACQSSASFTSSRRHIVSVGEDSRVYLWDHNDDNVPKKSERSCETLLTPGGVSVAVPWSDPHTIGMECASQRASLSSWFSSDGSYRASVTWPEERLPLSDDPPSGCANGAHGLWGLVFVTGNWDGTIRTFHNYGLPLRM